MLTIISKASDISFDPTLQKFTVRLVMILADGNPQMLKAKAQLYAGILDGLDELVEAKIGEFADKYGGEVIKHIHRMH